MTLLLTWFLTSVNSFIMRLWSQSRVTRHVQQSMKLWPRLLNQILHRSTRSSKYGHFSLQKTKMATTNAKLQAYKPVGDVTMGLHFCPPVLCCFIDLRCLIEPKQLLWYVWFSLLTGSFWKFTGVAESLMDLTELKCRYWYLKIYICKKKKKTQP